MGAIVCKLDFHKKVVKRGYIAMLAVDSCHRKRKIGSTLVKRAIDAMIAEDADEVSINEFLTASFTSAVIEMRKILCILCILVKAFGLESRIKKT